MKPIFKITGAVIILFFMFIADIPNLSDKWLPEAQAFRGRGAAFVVGAAVGSSASSSAAASASASAAASQQQAAAAQQQAATAQQQAAAAQQQAAIEKEKAAAAQQQATLAQQPAAASGSPLPLGTVVSALPPGCVSTPVGGVNYYYCGGNFYQAKYQGSSLVYVTTKPK